MRFPAPLIAPLLAAGLMCAAGQAAHAAVLTVPVNHSARLPVPGRAASVVVGNPQVADVAVIDSRTVFVTGKGEGSTDVAVVDPLGRTLYAADIRVTLGPGRAVTVHRAGELAELSCDPRCMAPAQRGVASAQAAAPLATGASAAPLSLPDLPVAAGALSAALAPSAPSV